MYTTTPCTSTADSHPAPPGCHRRRRHRRRLHSPSGTPSWVLPQVRLRLRSPAPMIFPGQELQVWCDHSKWCLFLLHFHNLFWQCFGFGIRIRIRSGFNQVSGSVSKSGFGIRIQEGKNDPQKEKFFYRNFMFSSARYSLLRTEGFSVLGRPLWRPRDR